MPDGATTSQAFKTLAPSVPFTYTGPTTVDPMYGELGPDGVRARSAHGAPRNVLARDPLFRPLCLLLYVLHTMCIILPLCTLECIPRANRPMQTWSLGRCLRVRLSRQVCNAIALFELDFLGRDLSKRLDPAKLKFSNPLTMQPAPDAWLRGYPARMLRQLNASRGQWEPQFVHRVFRKRRNAFGSWNRQSEPEHTGFVPVEGFWFTDQKCQPTSPPRPRRSGQPVGLMFHGGGYVCGTAAENDFTSCIAKEVVQHTLIRHVLSVDYRLAPQAPWPLPLLDAISAYHHAVFVEGIAEDDLFIGGDSAGGHLALALTRWIRDEGRELGLNGPRGLLLLSPWCDLGFTHQYGPDGWHHNRLCDTIADSFGPFASSLLTRAMSPSAVYEDVYLAPASRLIRPTAKSFEGFPPTMIVYGGAERISREIVELFARVGAARRSPLDVLHCEPQGIHDFMVFPHFADEARESYALVDKWLLRVLASDESTVHFPGIVVGKVDLCIKTD